MTLLPVVIYSIAYGLHLLNKRVDPDLATELKDKGVEFRGVPETGLLDSMIWMVLPFVAVFGYLVLAIFLMVPVRKRRTADA